MVRVWASNDLGAGKMAAVYFHTPWWSFKKGPNLEEIPTVEELLNDEGRSAHLSSHYLKVKYHGNRCTCH